MAQALGSKEAQAYLIDPINAPEPSAETGPGTHFGSTFASPKQSSNPGTPTSATSSNNPYRSSSIKKSPPPSKNETTTTSRPVNGSPRERFPDYRAEAFAGVDPAPRKQRGRSSTHGHEGTPPSYQDATSSTSIRRRGSSLRERYPGDRSGQPLDMIRRDSKKAYRSPHLHKRSLPGADMVDRLDPAIGGRAYHHEGPYDAALMARNRNPKTAPLAALEASNEEALKATPRENIKDAVERHQPLDGVAVVPPGVLDRFGRTYKYEEGADLMHEESSGDAGYKRWPGKDYDPEDLKGESEPMFSLDRALKAHKIDENGIEMEDRAHINRDYHDAERNGTLDPRDPVKIAGDDGKYVDMEIANTAEASGSGTHPKRNPGLGGSLKKRIGSLRKKRHDE